MKKYPPKPSFTDLLDLVIQKTKTAPTITLHEIFLVLSGKGYAALLVILSLPFCLPIQIPGFSTPFGLILAFLGLRIAFAKRLWWPKKWLSKAIDSKKVEKLANMGLKVAKKLQKVLHQRLLFMIENPLLHRLHGLIIFGLALLLLS